MIEMRWLWKESLELVNDKLVALLGEEPHTPLDAALAVTLEGLDCRETKSPPRRAVAGAKGEQVLSR